MAGQMGEQWVAELVVLKVASWAALMAVMLVVYSAGGWVGRLVDLSVFARAVLSAAQLAADWESAKAEKTADW